MERKTTPHGSRSQRSQLVGEKSYWHQGGREPAPGRGLQGAGDCPGKPGQGVPAAPAPLQQGQLCARPVHPPRPVDSRCCPAADMCAARTPPLAHIFRGTFVHSTWTCPMEVLRDHLLGVSDSGKVSGRGSGAPRAGGGTLARCCAFRVRSGTERALWLRS